MTLILCLMLLGSCFSVFGQTAAKSPSPLIQQLIDLPAPVDLRAPEDSGNGEKERKKEFYDDSNPPPDDAPLEDLLEYWKQFPGTTFSATYRPKPSDKTLERLLEHFNEHPENIASYLSVFPPRSDIADKVKKISDEMVKAGDGANYALVEWLKFNSTYYKDDLLNTATNIRDENNYVQNPSQYALRALARVDWDTASSIVSRLENDPTNPYSQVLAKWVLYQHAIDTGDFSTEQTYRKDLQEIVANRQATWAMRDLAMDALAVSSGWEGRDDWYVSLLEDETLQEIQSHGYTGLTTLIQHSPRKKWQESMINLLKSSNMTVRSTAARNLLVIYKEGNKDILEALLPWLEDPNWIKGASPGERSSLINYFGDTLIPEAVPALIAIVTHDEDNRDMAATSLAKYKDPRAVPILRTMLAKQEVKSQRDTFIGAIMSCGGFTDDELMNALEAYVVMASTPAGEKAINRFDDYYDGDGDHDEDAQDEDAPAVQVDPKPLPLNVSIGSFISAQEEPAEGLAFKAIQRVKVLWRINPKAAGILEGIIAKWKGRPLYLELLRRIRAGEGNIEDILTALVNRKEMREKVPTELTAMHQGDRLSRAVAVCVGEDANEYYSILSGNEWEAQAVILGCARMLRHPLPLGQIAALMDSPNKILAAAARRYLESQDSLEARKYILAKHPGTALILGSRTSFIPDEVKSVYTSTSLETLIREFNTDSSVVGEVETFRKKEDGLRQELLADPDMLAVYALIPEGLENKVIRVYKDRAVFTFYETGARYWERSLTSEEYQSFYDLLIEKNIDSVKLLSTCRGGCGNGEFIMFGRDGGRRIYFTSAKPPAPLDRVEELFDSFMKGEGLRLRYLLGDKKPGLEVLWTDENRPARSVWAKNGEVRVVLDDRARYAEIQKGTAEESQAQNASLKDGSDSDAGRDLARRLQQKALDLSQAHLSWQKLESGKDAGIAAQPAEAQYLYDQTQLPQYPDIKSEPRAWQTRAGSAEIRVGEYHEPGLFRITAGQPPAKIKEGYYFQPMVTGDGKWVVVTKTGEEGDAPRLMRINLQTGRELPVAMPASDTISAVAFIPSLNKMLVRVSNGSPDDVYNPEALHTEGPAPQRRGPRPPAGDFYHLLDAATGLVTPIKGEFRPLEDQSYRPLQSTGIPGEFWAALPDPKANGTAIGKFNEKTLTFKPVMSLPDIALNSMSVWIDELTAKIYFVYEGHLLSVPMK